VSLHQGFYTTFFVIFCRYYTKHYGSEKQKEKETGKATFKVCTSCTGCRENPKKRKQWTDESMLFPIEAVNSGSTTITQTSNQHKVLRQTLQDRIFSRVKHGINP